MKFETPLIPAQFVRRYKRFFCDARLEDGREVTAHCPNPGSMLTLLESGQRIWLSYSDNPKRKLKYGWELVQGSSGFVGINTGRANRIVAEALAVDRLEPLRGYTSLSREVPYGERSRIDFLLRDDKRPPCYLEVKSVTMSRQTGLAEFPDSVTARGTKHLEELARVANTGERAVLLFLIQRNDAERMTIADDVDPAYMRALRKALRRGVEVFGYKSKISTDAIRLAERVPVEVGGPKPA